MVAFEAELKAAYDAWKQAENAGDLEAEEEARNAYAKLEDSLDADACIYQGEVWPEHDYGEYECRRCGAEAPYDEDA